MPYNLHLQGNRFSSISWKPRIEKSSAFLIYIYLREIILPSFIYTIFDISRYDTYREH